MIGSGHEHEPIIQPLTSVCIIPLDWGMTTLRSLLRLAGPRLFPGGGGGGGDLERTIFPKVLPPGDPTKPFTRQGGGEEKKKKRKFEESWWMEDKYLPALSGVILNPWPAVTTGRLRHTERASFGFSLFVVKVQRVGASEDVKIKCVCSWVKNGGSAAIHYTKDNNE